MKKIFICMLLIIISAASFSQQTNPAPQLTKQDYLQKSKRQKTTAWVLMGAGVLSASLGSVKFNFAGSDGEVDNSNSTIFLITGLAAIGVSIPLFIASSRNKKMAGGLSLKHFPSHQLQKASMLYTTVPSLSLKISL